MRRVQSAALGPAVPPAGLWALGPPRALRVVKAARASQDPQLTPSSS